jgi:hypothetical protein
MQNVQRAQPVWETREAMLSYMDYQRALLPWRLRKHRNIHHVFFSPVFSQSCF